MELLSREIVYTANKPEKNTYKARFTTEEGVLHRVDFDDDGRIENLCAYTSHTPNLHVNDLQQLVKKVKDVLKK